MTMRNEKVGSRVEQLKIHLSTGDVTSSVVTSSIKMKILKCYIKISYAWLLLSLWLHKALFCYCHSGNRGLEVMCGCSHQKQFTKWHVTFDLYLHCLPFLKKELRLPPPAQIN
jgi:hypothetical protein